MTGSTTPLLVLPTTVPGAASSGSSTSPATGDPAAATAFASLMGCALGLAAPTPPVPGVGTPRSTAPSEDQTSSSEEPATTPADPGVLVAAIVAALFQQSVPAPTAAQSGTVTGPATTLLDPPVDGGSDALGSLSTAPAAALVAVATSSTSTDSSGTDAQPDGRTPAPTPVSPVPGRDAAAPLGAAPGSSAASCAGSASGSPDLGATNAPDASTSSAQPPPGAAAPASATVSAPVTASSPSPATPATQAVVAQVIPEVTRLVSDGDGVHRITLQLNPRALGEVRVVLTMRQGDVHVRLAAGSEARAALTASSADLTRALERAGFAEHRITLGNLTGPATATDTRLDTRPDPQQRSGAGHGSDQASDLTSGGSAYADPQQHHQHDAHPGTGARTEAMDGSTHHPSERAAGHASNRAAGRAPLAGAVDLRM